VENSNFSGSVYIKTAALIGAVIGQLVFGALADKLGRRLIFVCTISMVIIGALASCVLQGSPDSGSIYVHLFITRLVLGIGIGGEYPLGATVSSESASTQSRGGAVSGVFAMQGWGQVTAGLLSWGLLAAGVEHEVVWRVCLGFTAVPGLLTVYWRYKMNESKAFIKSEAEATGSSALLLEGVPSARSSFEAPLGVEASPPPLVAAVDSSSLSASSKPGVWGYIQRLGSTLFQYRWLLLGTAGSWFIFDVTFYANGLFSNTVFALITPKATIVEQAADILYTALLGLPGYYLGVFLIDRMGRRSMQLFGFAAVAVTFLVMASLIDVMAEYAVALLVILYGLTFLFANWGPNTTTYVIPTECFPTKVRATCHGISAASGKLGAVVGSYGIGALEVLGGRGNANNFLGLRYVLVACGLISAFGGVWTMIFTKDMSGISIEEIDAGMALRRNFSVYEARKRHEGGFVPSMDRASPGVSLRRVVAPVDGAVVLSSDEGDEPVVHFRE
jgi:MFS transporter, PHS family, inorganic phosphate transporter